jgi:hypothetical protein
MVDLARPGRADNVLDLGLEGDSASENGLVVELQNRLLAFLGLVLRAARLVQLVAVPTGGNGDAGRIRGTQRE